MKTIHIVSAATAAALLYLLGRCGWQVIHQTKSCVQPPAHSNSSESVVSPLSAVIQTHPQRKPYIGQHDLRWMAWHEKEKADPAFQWKTPIRFYGIVVDESGVRVPAVDIHFGWNGIGGSRESFATSGVDGSFQLSGVQGKILTVEATKHGYHTSGGKGGQAFEYAAFFESNYHEPDAADPVVFHLVKKLESEIMTRQSTFKNVSYDAMWYYELQNGRIVNTPLKGPGVSFKFERSESAQAKPFDWNWRVEGIQLGILPISAEFPQLAPEGKYPETWDAARAASTRPFKGNWRERFYLRTEGGIYGWMELEIAQPNDRALGPTIRVSSYLNPSGSRVIEVDPTKVLSNQ